MQRSKVLKKKVLFPGIIILCAACGSNLMAVPLAKAKAVSGATCPNSNISFGSNTYKAGDTVTLTGSSTAGTWSLCMYDTATGNRVAVGATSVGSISYKPAAAATLAGTIRVGGACSMTYAGSAADCRADNNTVTAATAADPAAGGGATTAQVVADKPQASTANCDTNGWAYCNPLKGTIDSIIDAGTKSVQTLLGLIGLIALVALVYAGITYVISAGNEEKIKQAKNIITYTVIGLGVALLAFSLLQTILSVLK